MRSLLVVLICCLSVLFSACVREEFQANTPQSNFEALWKIIDTRYCFLDYKKEAYGLDWNQIHTIYSKRIKSSMPPEALYEVLSEMVNELRDGHVNLSSSLGISQYRTWWDAYPHNFSDSLQSRYWGKDYQISSGLKYKVLQNNIGYVYIPSFSNDIGEANLDQMLYAMRLCKAIIIDVRDNGGGNLTTAQSLASRFTNEKVLLGYIQHKQGPGHSDFSTPQPVYLSPSGRIRWQKPAIVLINRRSFSATNDFANAMKQMPKVTLLGDKTGGGSGLPFSSELPNGWVIRFSASPLLNPNHEQIEFGIEPDVHINQLSSDYLQGKDTLLETAFKLLDAQSVVTPIQ